MAIVNGPYKSPTLFCNINITTYANYKKKKDCGNQPDGYSDGIQVHFYFMLWLASEWTLFSQFLCLPSFCYKIFKSGIPSDGASFPTLDWQCSRSFAGDQHPWVTVRLEYNFCPWFLLPQQGIKIWWINSMRLWALFPIRYYVMAHVVLVIWLYLNYVLMCMKLFLISLSFLWKW